MVTAEFNPSGCLSLHFARPFRPHCFELFPKLRIQCLLGRLPIFLRSEGSLSSQLYSTSVCQALFASAEYRRAAVMVVTFIMLPLWMVRCIANKGVVFRYRPVYPHIVHERLIVSVQLDYPAPALVGDVVAKVKLPAGLVQPGLHRRASGAT
jgi:hypothetical protein